MVPPNGVTRRVLLCGAACALCCVAAPANVPAATGGKSQKPERMPPQIGDLLAHPSWENDGALIAAGDIRAGEKPLLAFPRDPTLGITRERSRLNQILLVRISPEQLTGKTRQRAADGLLAYSGVCTHTACGVSEWNAERQHFVCPCHSSEFDAKNDAAVINGPARRALPHLPITIEDDRIVVAAAFSGRVGAKKKKS